MVEKEGESEDRERLCQGVSPSDCTLPDVQRVVL
jgi:hypothetical protein